MQQIGILIVSHSHKLAGGLKEILDQLSAGKVFIGYSGGIRGELGSNPEEVAGVLRQMSELAGIVAFFDLGSALLSCETALELLGEPLAGKVRIMDAPLVEGAIAATVEASLGSPLEKVCEIAREARRVAKIG